MGIDSSDGREASREELILALQEAHQQVLGLQAKLAEMEWIGEALRRRTVDLGERVKELGCLYAISDCLRDLEAELPEILQRIVNLIPIGYQHPERTWARLSVGGNIYCTPGFRETAFRQDQSIQAGKRGLGTVQVHVQPGRGPNAAPAFLDQEADLLAAVAVWIGEIVEQRQSRTQRRLGLETSFLKAWRRFGRKGPR
jgi:hypothetical protein